MGLFTQGAPPPPPQDILSSSKTSLPGFSRRIVHIENKSWEINMGVKKRDTHLDFDKKEIEYNLKRISERMDRLKLNTSMLNNKINDTISVIKQLARENDYQEIKDNVNRLDIPNLVTRNEFIGMTERYINKFIKP